MEPEQLNGRVVLVTGGARRIGAAIVRELHARGMRVMIHYRRSAAEAERLAAELGARRADSTALVAGDLGDEGAAVDLANAVRNRFGGLDLLVNNAADFYPSPLAEFTRARWRSLLASNLEGPLFLTLAMAPLLAERRGSVVNLTDANLAAAAIGHAAYVATKSGLTALTGSLARELAPEVRVNAVAPGAILWPEPEPAEATKQQVLHSIPLGRIGDPADVARAVAYLASEPYLTGVTLRVDGGRGLGP